MSLVTIITVTHNLINADRKGAFRRCLESVHNQTYDNIEHIVVDGASNDGTITFLKKYAQRGWIKYVSESDTGIYDAMNKGVKMANGEWIYFLGSDDEFYERDVLKNIFIDNDYGEKFDLIYGNVIFSGNDKIHDGKFSQLKLMQKNICHQSIFYRRCLFDKFGYFNTAYKVLADWDANIRLFSFDEVRRIYIDILIARYNSEGFSSFHEDEMFCSELDEILAKRFPFDFEYINNLKKKIKILEEENNHFESSIFLRPHRIYIYCKKKIIKSISNIKGIEWSL